MPQVKLSASFTKDTQPYNGMTDSEHVETLLKNPVGRRYALVAYEVLRVTEEIKEGTMVPTVDFVHIEPVSDEQAAAVKAQMDEKFRARTNGGAPQDPLPFGDGVTSERPKDEWLDDGQGGKKAKK